jgi:hypothetical protein
MRSALIATAVDFAGFADGPGLYTRMHYHKSGVYWGSQLHAAPRGKSCVMHFKQRS